MSDNDATHDEDIDDKLCHRKWVDKVGKIRWSKNTSIPPCFWRNCLAKISATLLYFTLPSALSERKVKMTPPSARHRKAASYGKRRMQRTALPNHLRPDYQPPRERACAYGGRIPPTHLRGVFRPHENSAKDVVFVQCCCTPWGCTPTPQETSAEGVFSAPGLKFPARRKGRRQLKRALPSTSPRAKAASDTYYDSYGDQRRSGEIGMGVWRVKDGQKMGAVNGCDVLAARPDHQPPKEYD